MSVLLIFNGLLVVILAGLYIYLKMLYNYWNKNGVVNPKAYWIIGNMGPTVTSTKSIADIIIDYSEQFKQYRYFGIYNFLTPGLVINDPDLVKNILVKDFDSFADPGFFVDENNDPIMGKNPFTLSGTKWKIARQKLTPNFTSAKIKLIYPSVNKVCQKFTNYLNDLCKDMSKTERNQTVLLELKDLCIKYTIENIAVCAFGLEANAFTKQTEPSSEFVQMGKKIGELSTFEGIKLSMIFAFPKLGRFFNFRFFSKELTDYMLSTIRKTLAYRRENNIVRNDFVDMMLKTFPNQTECSELEITAHAGGFFVDGVETSSVVMSHCLFEIARNHNDVQVKLRQEIDEARKKSNGNISYEMIDNLTYLDCVLHETLRLHSPVPFLSRACSQAFTLPPPVIGGREVHVKPGTPIRLAIHSIQTDSRYFGEPMKFRPARFLPENRNSIKKNTYYPFGDGPRLCVGMRFGVLQIKLGIIHLLENFEITLNPKTQLPLKQNPTHILRQPIGGLWIDLRKRQRIENN